MKIKRHDGTRERLILTGMIVDKWVLANISSKWTEEGLFSSRWANLIGGWCVQYFTSYEEAPGKRIQELAEAWAEEISDKETILLVERFLDSLSGEYERAKKESNKGYILDVAKDHFNRIKITKNLEAIQGNLELGKVDKAMKCYQEFTGIELGESAEIRIPGDEESIKQVFELGEESLVDYPGALGNFFGDSLCRDALIAFMGPEKSGKTFLLLDVAWRAMLQGRKVAFFEVGDMSQTQILRRFMVRAAEHPIKACRVNYPIYIEGSGGEKMATVDTEVREFDKALNYKVAWRACQKIIENRSSEEDYFLRLLCYPNSTVSVGGIRAAIKNWERIGWIPDVVVIDYADLLLPMNGTADTRDQINMTWKLLRSMSQSLHCLVVTATQANAASYKAETIDKSNFSEDKRKLAHATGIIGINQTMEEKEVGLCRLNWVVLREGEFTTDKCVHVAQCLPLANPAVLSTF